ncbi:hypothetical protein POX_e06490 [Penicillium oxalicum]|uniref:Uncharacterized protein n=1 Tax=Penicillium oxalicum (strain 114-2 / CGMCC 5302) TaxID=933388 RepID=S7ZFU1_PENO1|nr:hypothetical protein POX_e06490 [Penicillium oxalicum]EPS27526.1 hypothetical protein PDE_02469 [Penicillium oxalicum 114-2]KAI2788474.1 hypothetical protein POX_e06490 [Penicillium oxalicum]
MQSKFLAALLFSATALAAPQSGSISSDDMGILDSIPNSILTVLETAIPVSWAQDMMDPAFQSSVMSEVAAGTMPAWYSSLPDSVKAWATSPGNALLSDFAEATATAAAMASDISTAVTGMATAVAAAESTAAAAVSSAVSSANAEVSSAVASASSAVSAAVSSAHASATSTGGAPIATGGVAMSMVGAAGILGLALAL